VLEFANSQKYGFCSPCGEFAFVPSRSVLPKIYKWAGFREAHTFDLGEFQGGGEETSGLQYVPGVPTGSKGPIYAALLK
jgi:hypothetical protein